MQIFKNAVENFQENPTLPALDFIHSKGKASLPVSTRAAFCGRRLGLLTNPTGQTQSGVSAFEVLRAQGWQITTLFSPEHGPHANLEGEVESGSTEEMPLYSLYGTTRRPTPEMLSEVDTIVYDLQDVGARFYTYSSTLFHVLEECAKNNVAVVVLDRPNPLGLGVEGPIIEEQHFSFIGYGPLPITHGMTVGELARWFVAWKDLDMELHVVPVSDWHGERWDKTGLKWQRPSPNLPDFRAASWYCGLCLLEFCDFSVGRGTDAPFQILAAPHFNATKFLDKWQNVSPISATVQQVVPTHAKFAHQLCQAIRFEAQAPFQIVEFGLLVMATLAQTQNLDRENWNQAAPLLGSSEVLEWLWNGDFHSALQKARADSARFQAERAQFLLYNSSTPHSHLPRL